jgi:hypothetical protein
MDSCSEKWNGSCTGQSPRAAIRTSFVLGSRDETAGCQGCVATINADLSFKLRVRLPDAVLNDPSITRVDAKYLIVKGIRFAHGHENALTALRSSKPLGEKGDGVAICWRFVWGQKRGEIVWYAHVTVDVTAPPLVTGPREAAVLAVEFKADIWTPPALQAPQLGIPGSDCGDISGLVVRPSTRALMTDSLAGAS